NADVSVVEPIANSSILTFPIMTLCSSFNFSSKVALYKGSSKLASMLLEHVVSRPLVIILSFIELGTPNNLPFVSVDSSNFFAFFLSYYFFVFFMFFFYYILFIFLLLL